MWSSPARAWRIQIGTDHEAADFGDLCSAAAGRAARHRTDHGDLASTCPGWKTSHRRTCAKDRKTHGATPGSSARSKMEFRLSDGLEKIAPEEIDCAVLAGMGGDLIVRILSACSWRAREGLTLVLQPQSAGNVLRRWLYSEGLELLREEPVQDGLFYTLSWSCGRVSRAADARARNTPRPRSYKAATRSSARILRASRPR